MKPSISDSRIVVKTGNSEDGNGPVIKDNIPVLSESNFVVLYEGYVQGSPPSGKRKFTVEEVTKVDIFEADKLELPILKIVYPKSSTGTKILDDVEAGKPPKSEESNSASMEKKYMESQGVTELAVYGRPEDLTPLVQVLQPFKVKGFDFFGLFKALRDRNNAATLKKKPYVKMRDSTRLNIFDDSNSPVAEIFYPESSESKLFDILDVEKQITNGKGPIALNEGANVIQDIQTTTRIEFLDDNEDPIIQIIANKSILSKKPENTEQPLSSKLPSGHPSSDTPPKATQIQLYMGKPRGDPFAEIWATPSTQPGGDDAKVLVVLGDLTPPPLSKLTRTCNAVKDFVTKARRVYLVFAILLLVFIIIRTTYAYYKATCTECEY